MSGDFDFDPVAFTELQLIEASLSDVDTEIIAKQYLMTKDILATRQATIAKIPAFWAVVFEQAASDLEAAITGADLDLFTQALTAIEVDRPEIPAAAHASQVGLAHFGEPRSVTIRFRFAPNDVIADAVLEKTLHYRYGKDGFAGLVSAPVRVAWKAGKDLTEGLTDAAYEFWAAQAKAGGQLDLGPAPDRAARKARDAAARQMPEYKALKARLDNAGVGAASFFNFFSYRGRWTSTAEDAQARAERLAKRQTTLSGALDDDEDDDGEDDDESVEDETETFPAGDEVATAIAEDIFPSAIDYFLDNTVGSDDELDSIEINDDNDDDDVEMS